MPLLRSRIGARSTANQPGICGETADVDPWLPRPAAFVMPARTHATVRARNHAFQTVENQEPQHGRQVDAILGEQPLDVVGLGVHLKLPNPMKARQDVHERVAYRQPAAEGEEPPPSSGR
jgi:hypothetical protein